MTKIRVYIKRYLPLFIFASVLALLLLPFYRNGGIISGGEGSYYLDFTSLFNNYGFAWNNYGVGVYAFSLNFAYIFHLILLQNLFHNERVTNFVMIYSIYFLPFLAIYLLSIEIKVKSIIAFFISIFYIANPFSVNFLKSINQWNMLAAYILPSFFLIILKFHKDKVKLFILFGLNSLFFSFTNANPPTMAIYQIAIVFFVVLVSFYKEEKIIFKEIIKKYLIVMSSFLLFNFWWISTWFYAFFAVQESYSKEFAISILRGSKKFIPAFWQTFNLASLLGFPAEVEYDYTIAYYGQWWSPFLLAIPFLILIYFILKQKFRVRVSAGVKTKEARHLQKSYHGGVSLWVEAISPSKQANRHYKYQIVLGLMLILIGFLSKGVNGVFGEFYEFMVYHLPLFSIFKSAAEKWGIFFVFLLTLYLIFIFKGFKRDRFYYSISTLFIIYIIYISIPFSRSQFISDYRFNDEVTGSRKFIDKKEYQDLRKKLNEDLNEYRILSLPGSLNYQVALNIAGNRYYTGNDPVLNNTTKSFIAPYNGNFNQRFPVLFDSISDPNYLKLMGLYNIRKIVINKDEYPWFGFKEKESFLEKEKIFDMNLESEKNKVIDLYNINDDFYLPRFYIPDNIIYSPSSSLGNLLDVISPIDNLSPRSAFFIGYRATKESGFENAQLKDSASEVFITGELQSLVDEAKLQEGTQNFNQGTILFPYARWKPGGFMYPAVLQKEEKIKKQGTNNPELSFNQHLFFAAKRIYEIQKWGEELDGEQFKEILKRFQIEMEESTKDFGEYVDLNNDIYSSVLKFEVSFGAYRTRLFDVLGGSGRKDKEERAKIAKEIFDGLQGKIKSILIKHYTPTKYKFIIQDEGIYEILGENRYITSDWKIKNTTLDQNNKFIAGISGATGDNRWLIFGSRYFKKGTEILYFSKPPPINLISDKWDNLEKDVDLGSMGIIPNQGAFPAVFQEAKEWRSETDYHFSLKYRSNCQISLLFVEENREVTDPTIFDKINKYYSLIDRPFASDTEWVKLDYFLRSGRYAKAAKIFIRQDLTQECTNGTLDYKEAKIETVFDPKIILRRKDKEDNLSQIPEISFQKINPTKYLINVKKAKGPYFLVFSDSYDSSWRAYINNYRGENKDFIASYFNGEINESTPKNTFFDKQIFETWDKKSISEDRHVTINGYANSWYITPDDSGGNENYQIIVEYWPQKLFYIGLFITIGTLLFITIFGLLKLLKVKSNI